MKSFTERFSQSLEKRDSVLLVGLDPAISEQRNKGVISPKYFQNADANEARLKFCSDVLDSSAQYAVAAKPNEQYVFGLTLEQHQKLAENIRDKGLLSVYDCKLGDIGDTSESKLFWVHKAGYDAITVHTQPGNLEQMVKTAHSYDPPIGIIALTLMSNPEAVKYFKESSWKGKPLYLAIAEDVKSTGADGSVVGATGHVTEDEITKIRETIGEDRIILFPGVGAQAGDSNKIIRSGGKNVLINVGRDLIYSENPGEKAREYNNSFNNLRSFYDVADVILSTPGVFGVAPDDPRILVSRRVSPYYIDNRVIPSFPDKMNKVVNSMIRVINGNEKRKINKVSTTATAGISFASVVGNKLGIGTTYVREKQKAHGTESVLEGKVYPGEYVVGVDDLTTTGETGKKCVSAVKAVGGLIENYYVNVDRAEGASEDLKDVGVNLHPIVQINERFSEYGRRKGYITQQAFDVVATYIKNPLEWSRNFVENNPNFLKKKLERSVEAGKITDMAPIEVITKTHTELKEKFSPLIKQWLAELGVNQDVGL